MRLDMLQYDFTVGVSKNGNENCKLEIRKLHRAQIYSLEVALFAFEMRLLGILIVLGLVIRILTLVMLHLLLLLLLQNVLREKVKVLHVLQKVGIFRQVLQQHARIDGRIGRCRCSEIHCGLRVDRERRRRWRWWRLHMIFLHQRWLWRVVEAQAWLVQLSVVFLVYDTHQRDVFVVFRVVATSRLVVHEHFCLAMLWITQQL